MASTFMGLELAKRGLGSHQRALEVTGHNITNADNKEYSRQRVVLSAVDPIYAPAMNRANGAGQLGQGSEVAHVERIRSNFISERINMESNATNYWKTRHDLLYQVQIIYNEPTGNSLRSRFDQFWNSWQEISKYPQEAAARNELVERSVALSEEVRHMSNRLIDLRNQANILVADRVEKVNNIGANIRDLNMAIRKAESLGDSPNDLYDRREALIKELSKIVKIQTSRNDRDEFIIHLGSENLVQGDILQPLKLVGNAENEGYYDIQWQIDDGKPVIAGGELKAILEIRDQVLHRNINEIDAMAINMASMVNEIHRDGFGLNNRTNMNFFASKAITENISGNWDLDGDGQIDRTAIFKMSGVNVLNPNAEIGINGTMSFVKNDSRETPIYIDYVSTDTVQDVIDKINTSDAGLTAYMNHNGSLTIKANVAQDSAKHNFIIRHAEDSGQFLVGLSGVLRNSGPLGAYDWRRIDETIKLQGDSAHFEITPQFHPAQHLALNSEIKDNPHNIAAGKGKDIGGTGDYNTANGPGDGSNALSIASIRGNKGVMIDENSSFDDFFTSIVSRAGAEAAVAREHHENKETLLANLVNIEQSISGVNLDEEMANMVQFQNSYNASARMISTINQMLETIIRLGGA